MKCRGSFATVVASALLAAASLAPGTAAAFEPLSSFGSEGEGAGELSAPGAIAVAPDGTFFVADHGNDRVDAFAPTGDFLFAFGKDVRPGGGDVCDPGSGCQGGLGGDGAGALSEPEGIAVSNSGEVYVTEQGSDRVSVFSASGVFLFAFGYRVDPAGGNVCTAASGCQAGSNLRVPEDPELFTQQGPEGALEEPSGVAIGADGAVYVADTGNNRVSVFGPLGEFRSLFGIEVEGKAPFANVCSSGCIEGFGIDIAGGMKKPWGIATLPGGQLAIGDPGNQRLDVFSTEGEFIRALGHEVDLSGGDVCTTESGCRAGSGEGAGSLSEPAGLATTPTGAIVVGDPGLERVSRFNASGEFLRSFGAGVVDGADAFQICTALTGCRAGLDSIEPGATPHPFGVAEACGGSVFVSESTSGFAGVERFGDPDSAPLCASPGRRPPSQPPAVVSGRVVPSNFFELGRLKRNRHRGTATLLVAVHASGRLNLDGRGVMPASRNLAAATTVALPIRLVGKFRRQLVRAGNRKATAVITFTPDGGNPRSEERRLTLVKKPKQRQPRRHRRG